MTFAVISCVRRTMRFRAGRGGRTRRSRTPSCDGRARSAERRSPRGARRPAGVSRPLRRTARCRDRRSRARRRCAAASSCRIRTARAAPRARPARTSKLTSRSAAKLPNVLVTFRMSMPMTTHDVDAETPRRRVLKTGISPSGFHVPRAPVHRSPRAVLHDCLQHERDEREKREQRRDGERRLELIFVVENLDVQRQRVGQPSDVARDDRHGAELAHRAGVAENDAVEQAPLDVRQRHAEKRLEPARRPARAPLPLPASRSPPSPE